MRNEFLIERNIEWLVIYNPQILKISDCHCQVCLPTIEMIFDPHPKKSNLKEFLNDLWSIIFWIF